MIKTLLDVFEEVEDPRRRGGNYLYPLPELFLLTLTGVICGADEWTKIEDFGHSQLSWLRQYLPFRHGIPSHDTLGRIFGCINSEQFERCFTRWTEHLAALLPGEVVAIDGKTLRGSHERTSGKEAIHLISAFASANGLTLAQRKVEDKSNEITAIPLLLKMLDLQGSIVTIDAIGTQKALAEQIVGQQADYVLALKNNQPTLLQEVQRAFQHMPPAFKHKDVDAGHGRIEERLCEVITDLRFVDEAARWPQLKSIVRHTSVRIDKTSGQKSSQVRYFISSLLDGQDIQRAIRTHWHIENRLHWILDVHFREDNQRKRQGASAENFAIITKIALGLLRQETSLKRGIAGKRLKAAWDINYRRRVLKI